MNPEDELVEDCLGWRLANLDRGSIRLDAQYQREGDSFNSPPAMKKSLEALKLREDYR
jgi:hypothetical protein